MMMSLLLRRVNYYYSMMMSLMTMVVLPSSSLSFRLTRSGIATRTTMTASQFGVAYGLLLGNKTAKYPSRPFHHHHDDSHQRDISTAVFSRRRLTVMSQSRSTSSEASMNDDNVERTTTSDDISSNNVSLRKRLLREALLAIDMDANGLEQAVTESMIHPTDPRNDSSSTTSTTTVSGGDAGYYNGRFGVSAIKTCRSFYYPKKQDFSKSTTQEQLQAAAVRTARQVEFLWKRHQSHAAEYVRHHDDPQQQHQVVRRFPIVLVLDNLRSAYNVGSLYRTADAAGVTEVVTVGITPTPGNGKLQKSALGAELTVPTRHFATLKAALEYLRNTNHANNNSSNNNNYQLVGLETTKHSVLYTDFSYDINRGVALILGNEVTSVSVDVLLSEQLDAVLEIPIFGVKNSLNVAACAPTVVYEILRQWNVVVSANNNNKATKKKDGTSNNSEQTNNSSSDDEKK